MFQKIINNLKCIDWEMWSFLYNNKQLKKHELKCDKVYIIIYKLNCIYNVKLKVKIIMKIKLKNKRKVTPTILYLQKNEINNISK